MPGSASPPESAADGGGPELRAPERLREDFGEDALDPGALPDGLSAEAAGAGPPVVGMGTAGPYVLVPVAAEGDEGGGGGGGDGGGGGGGGAGRTTLQLMVTTPDGQLLALGALPSVPPGAAREAWVGMLRERQHARRDTDGALG